MAFIAVHAAPCRSEAAAAACHSRTDSVWAASWVNATTGRWIARAGDGRGAEGYDWRGRTLLNSHGEKIGTRVVPTEGFVLSEGRRSSSSKPSGTKSARKIWLGDD